MELNQCTIVLLGYLSVGESESNSPRPSQDNPPLVYLEVAPNQLEVANELLGAAETARRG